MGILLVIIITNHTKYSKNWENVPSFKSSLKTYLFRSVVWNVPSFKWSRNKILFWMYLVLDHHLDRSIWFRSVFLNVPSFKLSLKRRICLDVFHNVLRCERTLSGMAQNKLLLLLEVTTVCVRQNRSFKFYYIVLYTFISDSSVVQEHWITVVHIHYYKYSMISLQVLLHCKEYTTC